VSKTVLLLIDDDNDVLLVAMALLATLGCDFGSFTACLICMVHGK
jgi:FixJ family two-component response regulator